MDITNLGFIALMTIGFVNIVTFFKSDMDSKVKIGLTILFAFALTFVPADWGSIIADKLKLAIETALLASGTYKLAQKIGGE
jgi:hypothetical protein